MNRRTKLRGLLALTAWAAGGLGEIFSPALFGYGFGVDGVIALQMLFVGLTLLAIYVTFGETVPEERATQSPSVPTLGSTSTETPGARVERFLAHFRRESIQHTLALVVIVLIPLVEMLWLTAELASYGLLSEFPESTRGFTNMLLQNSSGLAGMFLFLATICLRIGTDEYNHTMVRVSSVLLILTALLWVFAQWSAYAIVLEYLGNLEPSDYIALARLSSDTLFSASMGGLMFGWTLYFLGPRVIRTVEPTQELG